MRRFWPLVLAGGIIGAALLSYRSARAPQPKPSMPSYQGAPTNQPPPQKTRGDGTLTAAEIMAKWRTAILRRDIRAQQACRTAILEHWDTYGPLVRKAAEDDAEDRVRAHSLAMLMTRGDASLAPFFAKRLEVDPSPFVQENCCRALGELKAKEYRDLVARFETHEVKAVAAAAREALAQMK